jgi:hypothetical protein
MAKRFKTEKEFIEVYGPDWRTKPHICFIKDMDKALGEPYDGPLGIVETPYWKRQKWEISQYLLTDKPLLPIGTKVAIPRIKSIGYSLETLIKPSTKFFYYTGTGGNSSVSGHLLSNANIKGSGYCFTASEILEAHERYNKENSSESLLEEAKRRYPVGTKFKCLHGWSGGLINDLSEIKIDDDDGRIKWYNSKNLTIGYLYAEGKWAEIIELECIAKAGEWVKITDFGKATAGSYMLNKPYKLFNTLNRYNGFMVYKENNGNSSKIDGWSNAFDLGMKFEKCEEPKFNNQFTEKFVYPLTTHIHRLLVPDIHIDIGQIYNNLNFKQNETKQDKQRQSGSTIKTNRKTTAITTGQGYAGNSVSSPKRQPKITVGYIGN